MKRFLGKKKLLKIYIDNNDRYRHEALWEALLKKSKELNMSGATVYKAVSGIGAHTKVRTFNVWSLSQELPIIIEMIDNEEKIENFLKNVDDMIKEGLVTLSDVEVISYKHNGNRP
jgi:PII-like signaling protein